MPKSFVLKTDRLRLRPCGLADLGALHCLWTDPDVRRYLWDDEIIETDVVRTIIASSANSFREHGFGQWIVAVRGDRDCIGFCGLRYIEVDSPDIELLYGLFPAFWKRGYATEAAGAVLRHAFDGGSIERVVADIDPPNRDSAGVLERLGMRFVRLYEREGVATKQYEITSDMYFHDRDR